MFYFGCVLRLYSLAQVHKTLCRCIDWQTFQRVGLYVYVNGIRNLYFCLCAKTVLSGSGSMISVQLYSLADIQENKSLILSGHKKFFVYLVYTYWHMVGGLCSCVY